MTVGVTCVLGDDQGDLVDGEEETEKKEEKTTDGLEIWEILFSSKCSFFVLNVCKSFCNLSRKSPVRQERLRKCC